MIQISLLGPLVARVNGDLVTPTAPKPRQVLVLLASCANSVVCNDQIIDELWGDHPPVSVTTTLQTYVYQLRKCLGLTVAAAARRNGRKEGEGDELRTFAGGYMLTLDPDKLDSMRFEKLVNRGRAELEQGSPATASRSLTEALRLWRGPTMVDVNRGPILRVEVARLEEARRCALETRIEADLQLGRHHEIISDLTALVTRQPIHEGFQAKLMLALYRAGRRSEALNVYHHARTALISELGVEPSGELQRLHRAILSSSSHLDSADAVKLAS